MVRKTRSISIVSAALVLCLALGFLTVAEAEEPGANVRVTFTLGQVQAKDKKAPLKSFALVVTSDGPRASLLTGARVPIPTTLGSDDGTVTSFTYQNVGLSAEVEAAVLLNGHVQIRASVENSWIDPATADTTPVVETRHQQISVVLKDGVALEIARSSDGETIRYVEVQADILD